MIEERAAERAHEEIVGQNITLRDGPERQLRAVVMAHDEGSGIAVGDEFVVPAAVDLHLVLVEPVHEIDGRNAKRRIEAGRIVYPKRRVGQMRGARLVDRGLDAARREAAPDRRQFGQNRAIAVELARRLGREIGEAIGAGEMAVEIVEAAVLRVKHDDRLDFLKALSRARRILREGGLERQKQESAGQGRTQKPKIHHCPRMRARASTPQPCFDASYCILLTASAAAWPGGGGKPA